MKATAVCGAKFVPGLTAALVVLFLAVGCGSDSSTGSGNPEQLIAQGWTQFESGNFSGAEASFTDAIAATNDEELQANAYEGRAWSRGRLGDIDGALADFIVVRQTGINTQVRYAGISLVYLALKEYLDARENANWALTLYGQPINFEHDPDVTDTTIKLVRMIANFNYKAYLLAADDVADLGGPVLNPSSKTFVADLLEAIQELREQYGQGLLGQ